MNEAIQLIKELLQDEEAWLTAFPGCSETKALVLKAESFLKEHENV